MSVVSLKYDKINEFGRREICYEADTTGKPEDWTLSNFKPKSNDNNKTEGNQQ